MEMRTTNANHTTTAQQYGIQHCVYINLAIRSDRRIAVERELMSVGINATRFDAICPHNNITLSKMCGAGRAMSDIGAIGCTMSHIACLRKARADKLPYIMIVEDDIRFTNPTEFRRIMTVFLSKHPIGSWDVAMVAGNNLSNVVIPGETGVDHGCVKIQTCQTTTGYIVGRHYYDILIDNFTTGVDMLASVRIPSRMARDMYAIDRFWFRLQERDRWMLLYPLTVTQAEGKSDIEGRVVNYDSLMLNLFKHFR